MAKYYRDVLLVLLIYQSLLQYLFYFLLTRTKNRFTKRHDISLVSGDLFDRLLPYRNPWMRQSVKKPNPSIQKSVVLVISLEALLCKRHKYGTNVA